MNARTWPLLLALPLLAVAASAQESVRDLGGPGKYNKFLTPNQLDRWLFDGEKGETIIAHVVSKEFDPILELARGGSKDAVKDERPILEVDDPGNESRYSVRLPEKGKYEIRVHAFKYQGGGNYSLRVQRFQAQPLAVGKPSVGAFDREGKSYHHFQAAKGQILIPELKGVPPEAWRMIDPRGRDMDNWAGTVLIEEGGESHLIVDGHADYRYGLLVREARQRELPAGKGVADSLQQGELDVWSFEGKPGDFRLLEVEKTGEVRSRLLYAPPEKKAEQRLTRTADRPEVTLLPVASRGGRLRYAAILGREGRYQLQLLARTPASYKLIARDPSVPLEWGKEIEGSLPVGGAAFYSFKATPGQLLQASLGSKKFIPRLRLYDAQGGQVGGAGDGDGEDADGGSEGRITHMVLSEGLYRLQVGSLGDGGGGDFRLALTETKLKELQIGGRGTGAVQPGAMEFWAFAGKEGQTVFLNVRSGAFEPTVSVRSPDGLNLAADNRGDAATGSLLALKLPKTGRHTVWIGSRRGAGEYTVRLIDGD